MSVNSKMTAIADEVRTLTRKTGAMSLDSIAANLKAIPRQGAKTVTPSTSSQTAIVSGVYTTGDVTVAAIPSSYVQPSGTLEIKENGTHDVKNYAFVNVDVAGGGGSVGVGVSVSVNQLSHEPVIDISMADGSNLGVGGSAYSATNNGGSFTNGKFVIDGTGSLTVPTAFMAGTGKWTVAFTVDTYTVSTANYSRIVRGNNDVPSIFYTKSKSKFQSKLAYGSANTSYASISDSSFVTTDSNGAMSFSIPTDEPTTFVFRNDGNYISLWVNGSKKIQEPTSRYSSDKYASTFSIGDNADVGTSMTHMECSMLKLWDKALLDTEVMFVK